MKLRGAARSFMAAGVACLIIYVLVGLYGLSASASRVGSLLLYVGIAILVIGLALRLLRGTSPS